MNWMELIVFCVIVLGTGASCYSIGVKNGMEAERDRAEAARQAQARMDCSFYETATEEHKFLARVYRQELMKLIQAAGEKIPPAAVAFPETFIAWLEVREANRNKQEAKDRLDAKAAAIEHATDEMIAKMEKA